MINRIFIWGVGKGYHMVKESLDFSNIEIIGLIDNNSQLWGSQQDGYTIYALNRISMDYDYVIISVMNDIDTIKQQLMKSGVDNKKILLYFDVMDWVINRVDFINPTIRMMHLWEKNRRNIDLNVDAKLLNIEYEIADKIRKKQYRFPIIESAECALKILQKHSLSMCRFGDGEFEIIFRRNRPVFQKENKNLANRLKEILVNKDKNIITCIANNYGNLECYTESAAMSIRRYMQPSVRKEHLMAIDLNKTYYDAYVSRPYIMYQDKKYAEKIFALWKKVWDDRDIVVVEGRFTKSGYGNTLFENARSIERVLCPAENAWDCYKKIFDKIVQGISRDKLILIALGPTATVLAYDLAQKGYQAIDIGHIDNEYEWFMRGVSERVVIHNKYVHECRPRGRITEDVYDASFEKQVIYRIGIE